MVTVWVVIITAIIALGVGGGGSYYYINLNTEKETDSSNALTDQNNCLVQVDTDEEETDGSTIDTSDWETLKFEDGASIKYPSDWGITVPEYSFEGIQYFVINEDDKGNSGRISMYDLDEWLKGPNPDDIYVMQKDEREVVYQSISNIYSDRKLSPESRVELNDYNFEFFTYHTQDRTDVNYIESNDGDSRGFTMINAYGQDVSLATSYNVSLFNKNENTLLHLSVPLTTNYSEIDELVDQYGDYSQDGDELTRIDGSVHQDFVQLMMSNREDLSFGSYLDQIDTIAESVTY